MLQVTWEWVAIDEPALDVANTVAISGGVAHDLLEPAGEYERWAEAAAASPALDADAGAALRAARSRVLALREPIRAVLFATAAGEPLPRAAVTELNRASRKAPAWRELARSGELHDRVAGRCRRPPARAVRAVGDGYRQPRCRTPARLPGAIVRDALPTEPPRPTLVLAPVRHTRARRAALRREATVTQAGPALARGRRLRIALAPASPTGPRRSRVGCRADAGMPPSTATRRWQGRHRARRRAALRRRRSHRPISAHPSSRARSGPRRKARP